MKGSNRIIVTGASGFIGFNVCKTLLRLGFDVTAITRQFNSKLISENQGNSIQQISVDLDCEDIPKEVLEKNQVIIHCAGRAHVLKNKKNEDFEQYNISNTLATKRLALSAVNAGVKRLIFLSSIGVNGSSNTKPFTEKDIPSPSQNYALSKLEAEKNLQKIALSSELEVVIIRPTLVYGPGAPGNFERLIKWVNKSIPLPFG